MLADRGRATMHSMNSKDTACRSGTSRAPRRAAWPVLALLAGCGATQFEARPSIPPPLVTKIPVVVGVHITPEFRDKVYHEKRDDGEFAIAIGKAQADAFMSLMGAMFTRAVPVASADAGAAIDPEMRGVIEPVLEDFAFVTPADSGTDVYAVSLKYRVNGYRPNGEFFESWTFTGYGAAASGGLLASGTEALQKATHLAMRDAGAKLATEFGEQAVVRGLLPSVSPAPPAEVAPPATAEINPPPP
jgi:hypothetical protein